MKFFYLCLFFFALTTANAQYLKADSKKFDAAIQSDTIQLLDVRTAEEFKTGHIKNALQADWIDQEQFKHRVQYIDRNRPVYIYCLGGGRSSAAASWMINNGFHNVIELEGGLVAWKKNGLPVEASTTKKQMTVQEFHSELSSHKVVLVDFGAKWCPPCVKMEPVLNKLVNNKSISFYLLKVDAGIHTDLMKSLGVEELPGFIIYKNGKEIWRKTGIVSQEELSNQLQ